jgi:hypothetical protein
MDKLKDQSRASMEAAMQEAEQPSSLPVFPHESHSILVLSDSLGFHVGTGVPFTV